MSNYVEVYRGKRLESKHRIHAVAVDAKGNIIARVGDPTLSTYFRSSAKPFQTLALFRSGVINHFDFSDKEIALTSASHNGEEFHVQAVRQMLLKIGANEADLKCGFHPPIYPPAMQKFYAEHHMPSPVYNNCSGKHTGMLAACIMHGYDLATYLEPDHPHQKRIKALISEFSGIPEGKIGTGIDGCGVPVFYMSLQHMAKMYAQLAASDEPAVVHLRTAMMRFPEYVGGSERMDTELMRLLQDRVVSKTGAEAVRSFAFLQPEPVGIVLKSEDGQKRGVDSAAVEFLRQLRLISEEEAKRLRRFWKPVVRNHAGQKVGQIVPKFKVDILQQ